MNQNQETSMKRWCKRDGLQKSQRIEKQTLSGHLDGLQNVGANWTLLREQTHWIKYRIWKKKKKKKKRKIFI